MAISILHGDCLDVLPTLKADSFSACVTDPPYELGFMAKRWDKTGIAFRPETWREVFRVLKPGAHLVAFGGTRTFHRVVCAIEDAGFEIRDTLCWIHGQGFPKSLDVSKQLDKLAGAEREVIRERYTVKRIKSGATVVNEGAWGKQNVAYTATDSEPATPEAQQWDGWGTALKPAVELICLARKPLIGTVVQNVLAHGTGAINVDASRVPVEDNDRHEYGVDGDEGRPSDNTPCYGKRNRVGYSQHAEGRWPPDVLHDGSPEVLAAFDVFGDRQSCNVPSSAKSKGSIFGGSRSQGAIYPGDTGSATRFFPRCKFTPDELRLHYTSKADAADRAGSKHPTVKPVSLLQWLVRLICPPGGRVLDPFGGTGTTAEACMLNGFDCTLIEREAEYVRDIQRRIGRWSGQDTPLLSAIGD